MSLLKVRHNIEVAHRLIATPGKCEAIHGHSMWVIMSLGGKINPKTGMLAYDHKAMGREIYDDKIELQDLEFGAIKRSFREHLDTQYDHRVLLNAVDPFAGPIFQVQAGDTYTTHPTEADNHSEEEVVALERVEGRQTFLPGLNAVAGDPTTENIAKWIYEWARGKEMPVREVEVWETSSNCAVYDGA